ncbi:12093_t:CDS:2 [Acaulospora morrowiae]|uniref:12093_t:CDS:1 n=1 Tax=Acaulospora morrowiae TaxID=94023 RepID=A0A9N9ABD6_9GLOM|nr:12093_t:CDS:2 [Acaulospora morrowiae]
MPQKRKASTVASAKIAEDAATNGSGSRKRKSDASIKGNNSNGDNHEQEQQQTPPNNDESFIEDSTSNNVENVVDSEAPPDKRRKKDEDEEETVESHQNGANGNSNGCTNPDTAVTDLKRDDMSFVLTSQQSQDQMLIDDFTKQSDDVPVSSSQNETTDPHADEHVTSSGNEPHENNEHLSSQMSFEEEKRKELEDKMPESVYEKGHIVFLYRPKTGVEHPESVDEVQRLYVILIPHFVRPSLKDEPISSYAYLNSHDSKKQQADEDKSKLGKIRSIIIGKKQLPEISKHDRFWAFVDKVFDNSDDVKEFVNGQEYSSGQKSCRLLGRGVYYMVEHKGQTHLAYVLEFPEEPTNVQKDFKIVKEGSYVISVKNPEVENPPQVGLPDYEQVKFPAHLEKQFQGRRFMSLPSTEFLDYRGCEFLLIGASNDIVGELGEEVGKKLEDLAEFEIKSIEPFAEKDIFDELRLEHGTIPTEPAFHEFFQCYHSIELVRQKFDVIVLYSIANLNPK